MNYIINIDLKPRLGVYDYDCIHCIRLYLYLHILSSFHVNVSMLDVDIRLLQSNIVRSVRLFVWFVYFLSYKNSICKVNNISCKNIIL